jgi:hypothetical protein
MVTVGSTAPPLQPGTSITAWFNTNTGDVNLYSGIDPINFTFRHCIVSSTAPTSPVVGTRWFNTTDSQSYTRVGNAWVQADLGPQGLPGAISTLSVAGVSTGAPGSNASVTIGGTAPNQTLTFTIPRGATGQSGLDGDKYKTTSSTNLLIPAIGTTITLTVGTGLSYSTNQTVLISNDISSHIHAEINSYNPATGVMTAVVTDTEGSGTYSSWVVNLSGAVGPAGTVGPAGPAGTAGPNTVTTSTTSNLTGYIFGNGTNIAGATAASSAATPNTLVLRAADGTFSAASTAEEVVTITANASGEGSAAIRGVSTGTDNTGIGVAGFSENGIGVSGGSDDGTALVGISGTGTGGLSVSNSGTYHHKFGQWDVTTLSPAQSAVERVRGWFVWFFGEYVGRLKTANITASREWTLPDESGTVALARNTGKTIFVDAGTGNDTRGSLSPYSISVPFATIGAAMAESVSGDTVRVRAGSHFVADTIALAGKGAVHFEDGAEVTFTGLGKYLFTLTANQSKSITGYGVFILAQGTAGFFQTGGGTNTVQLVNIQCGAIQAHSTVVSVFDLYTGVVVLKATTIQALGAKVAIVQGTSTNFNYDVKFTYCSQLLDIPVSNSNSQFSCVAWTVICYGAYGLRIVGGTTSLELKNLNMHGAGTPVAFEFANNDTNLNAHTLHGGRISSGSTAPCISFATSTATQKFVKLRGDVQLITGGTACITAGSARQVAVSSAHSNVAVGANVTVVGALTVNAAFTY